VQGRDLGAVASDIQHILRDTKKDVPPPLASSTSDQRYVAAEPQAKIFSRAAPKTEASYLRRTQLKGKLGL
jgi:hypothetical protein